MPALLILGAQSASMILLDQDLYAFASILVANGIIQTVNGWNQGYHTIEERNFNCMRYIFVMELINTGLLVLIYKWTWPISLERAGILVMYTIAAMCFTSNLFDLSRHVISLVNRFRDRGFRLELKQYPDDEFDDLPNTKKIFQDDLNKLYLGPEFNLQKKFSRALSVLFVCFIYSSYMPILYIVALCFSSLTMLVNKFLILNYYQRSESRVMANFAL